MVHLVEKATNWLGPVCAACMRDSMVLETADLCFECVGRIRVAHKCPNCGVVRCYYAMQAPNKCESCKAVLPDYNDILKSTLARKDYHLDKEIY